MSVRERKKKKGKKQGFIRSLILSFLTGRYESGKNIFKKRQKGKKERKTERTKKNKTKH